MKTQENQKFSVSRKIPKEFPRILKSKRGINDSSQIAIIIMVFILIGVTIPFINNEFETDGSEFNTGNVADDLIGENLEDTSGVGAGDVLLSVGKMFFWTFGDLPFWLDAIFLVLRIMLLIMILKNFIPFLGGG